MRMNRSLPAVAALLAVSVLNMGCTHARPAAPSAAATAPTLTGDPAHPGATQGWVRTELYFGLGPADHPEQGVSEAAWQEFLDREATPRFPAGLTVVPVYGQWQSKNDPEPSRLRSKVLIVLYLDNEENREKIDAIRAAWKQKTGDQSVLRVTQPADVSF